MYRSNKIYNRSSDFYYIEVWDAAKFRSKKLNNIFGVDDGIKIKYLCGGTDKPATKTKIHFALFWKLRKTAEDRIERVSNNSKFKDCLFIIRKFSRDEFFKAIPGHIINNDLLVREYWNRNFKMKKNEQRYVKNVENIKKKQEFLKSRAKGHQELHVSV
jgi:hypothetical protein